MNEITESGEDKIQKLSQQLEELQKSASPSAIQLPVAIVIASILISGSIMYATINYRNGLEASIKNPTKEPSTDGPQIAKSITPEDHVFGNPNAPVKIIEYSDLECPFCKIFHQTMNKIMDKYGKNNQVAWIYRHFPLDQLHSKARDEARATECAWEQGGNDAFWKYINKIFEITPSNDGLDSAELPRIAQMIGINSEKFVTCLASTKYDDKISKNQQDGVDSGARGTPYSILLTPSNRQLIINGAQPYENVAKLIDEALAEKK